MSFHHPAARLSIKTQSEKKLQNSNLIPILTPILTQNKNSNTNDNHKPNSN